MKGSLLINIFGLLGITMFYLLGIYPFINTFISGLSGIDTNTATLLSLMPPFILFMIFYYFYLHIVGEKRPI